jgi:hypothetical protein
MSLLLFLPRFRTLKEYCVVYKLVPVPKWPFHPSSASCSQIMLEISGLCLFFSQSSESALTWFWTKLLIYGQTQVSMSEDLLYWLSQCECLYILVHGKANSFDHLAALRPDHEKMFSPFPHPCHHLFSSHPQVQQIPYRRPYSPLRQ